VSRRVITAALLLGVAIGCSDPCAVVIGCTDAPRVAVLGRVLVGADGDAVPGASIRLLAEYPDHVDSVWSASDSRGLFSLTLPSSGAEPPRLVLGVTPRGLPGYLLPLDDCAPVSEWGDGCILNPLISKPNFPLFRFEYRNSGGTPLANVQVTFRRTGGPPIFRTIGRDSLNVPVDSLSVVTDASGYALLFHPSHWAGGMDPVLGDLTIDFPPPIGRTTRAYRVVPNAFFGLRGLAAQAAGPTLAYRFELADSASDLPLEGVELRYRRLSGVATRSDSFDIHTTADGKAFFALAPVTHGTITGDLSIAVPSRPVVTEIKGMTLQTFDEDSTRLFASWRVGATGVLYQRPPERP
jgi:hypothetical protein